jgi:hypothetical protein
MQAHELLRFLAHCGQLFSAAASMLRISEILSLTRVASLASLRK